MLSLLVILCAITVAHGSSLVALPAILASYEGVLINVHFSEMRASTPGVQNSSDNNKPDNSMTFIRKLLNSGSNFVLSADEKDTQGVHPTELEPFDFSSTCFSNEFSSARPSQSLKTQICLSLSCDVPSAWWRRASAWIHRFLSRLKRHLLHHT